MKLLYKEDWELTEKIFAAWWEKEDVGRPLIQIFSPKFKNQNLREIYSLPEELNFKTKDIGWLLVSWIEDYNIEKENWQEPKIVLKCFEDHFEKVFYGGEAFPQIWLNLGAGVVAAFLDNYLKFDGNTVWFELPSSLKWDEIFSLKFDPKNKWWVFTKKFAEYFTEKGKEKFIVAMTDLGGITDILASFRKTQTLLLDLIDYPEEVKKASSLILDFWLKYYNELDRILSKFNQGFSSWMNIWAPKRWYPIQCDFSAMISPQMFKEFVLPYLKIQCEVLDYTIYHLDGPGEIPHLDLLLDIKELTGIQWVPGAGNPPPESPKWFPIYEKIQKKNKLLVLNGVDKDNIPFLLKNLSHKGLLISTSCNSKEEAEKLLNQICKK